jgi:hypothetical protein
MFKATLPLLMSFTAYLCTVMVAVIEHRRHQRRTSPPIGRMRIT